MCVQRLSPIFVACLVLCGSGEGLAGSRHEGRGLPRPHAERSADAQVVEQLITLLDKTEDNNVAIVTIRTLGGMGSVAKPSVPAIIRNAGRLGLLDTTFHLRPDCFDRPAVPSSPIVMRAIRSILGANPTPDDVAVEKTKRD